MANSDHRFHAAEESCLRWLLKTMNGSTPAAETMRRYPLVWTILDCVFTRIPLFSLAKSLADRKFVAVLQQTLKDIAATSTDQSTTSTKRKRDATLSFSLETLTSTHGALSTAGSVFQALRSLLGRLQEAATSSSRDKIGAEHIKSLFCSPAEESVTVVAPSLACAHLLLENGGEEIDGSKFWIKTTSQVWDLHLQGATDQVEVAIHLFTPSCIILAQLDSTSSKDLKSQWRTDLEAFLLRNLVVQARTAFLNRGELDTISQALEVSRARIDCSGPVLYALASTAVEQVLARERRRHLVEWMKQVFRAIEACVRKHDARSSLIQTLLQQAIDNASAIDIKDLRAIANTYALSPEATNWDILAKVATCDPAVFQSSGDGSELLDLVCDRIVQDAQESSEDAQTAILQVITGVMRGFISRRDVSSFLKLWFAQLCKAEKTGDLRSPWFLLTLKDDNQSSSSIIEREISPQQVLEVLRWLEGEQQSTPHALSIILDAIAMQIKGENYVDAVGLKLFNILWPVCKKQKDMPLKWRIARKTLSWADAEERQELWSDITSQITKTLQKRPLKSPDTFEAFKCACQAWDSTYPDGDHLAEISKLVDDFTSRLAAELLSPSEMMTVSQLQQLEVDMDDMLQPETAREQYLSWYLLGCSRLNRLISLENGELPTPVTNAVSSKASKENIGEQMWKVLLQNDINLNDPKVSRKMVDSVIETFVEACGKSPSPVVGSMCIRLLARVPIDSYNRWQRERIMPIVDKYSSLLPTEPSLDAIEEWKSLLALSAKMMSRPTFHENMSFKELTNTAAKLFAAVSKSADHTTDGIELLGRYFTFASLCMRQMADNVDERSLSYFGQCSNFIQAGKSVDASSVEPFGMILLKALVVELGASASCQIQPTLSALVDEATETLSKMALSVVSPFLEDKKLMKARDASQELQLVAAVDASQVLGDLSDKYDGKLSAMSKIEKKSFEDMENGDVVAWKLQAFIHTHLPASRKTSQPAKIPSLSSLPPRLQRPLIDELVHAVTKHLSTEEKIQYLRDLSVEYAQGTKTNGQILGIQIVINQIIEATDYSGKTDGYDLSAACSDLASFLLDKDCSNFVEICRTLYTLLEKKSQLISQWNVEATLNATIALAANDTSDASFVWLCKLIEIVIKKHRLRLEGHYHLLLTTLQTLLRRLITERPYDETKQAEENRAHAYGRLITLICEPTAGAVSRSQIHSSLDSATDAAKRSAGRHMYLILMHYVKLQLEINVPSSMMESLESSMNTIFDITPPEGRKILNDAMDASGRAILREMFKRYVKFGKWTGV